MGGNSQARSVSAVSVKDRIVMSSAEDSRISASKPGYGSLAHTLAGEAKEGGPATAAFENGLERSLTFHHVSYEVTVHCGRRTKVILDSCRCEPVPVHT